MVRICKECGKKFETQSSRKLFCDDDHYRVCAVCGKSFLVSKRKLSTDLKTCSEDCRRMAISVKQLNIEPMHDCICAECGKHFKSVKPNAKICDSIHYRSCIVCGKKFEVSRRNIQDNLRTCSKECKYVLASRTMVEKYGVENAGQSAELREKMQQTMLQTYGADNALKSEDIRNKVKATNLERYGYEHPLQSPTIQAKSRGTNLRVRGVEYPTQSEDVKAKYRQTCLERYGVDNASKSADVVRKLISDPSNIDKCMEFHIDPRQFILDNFPSAKPTLVDVANMCGMHESSIGQIVLAAKCENLVQYTYSRMEDSVCQFLRSVLPEDVEIVKNTFRVITPYELDIYIPKYRLGIECNPTCTHNSTIGILGDAPKSKQYHAMKSMACNENNVFLFHIFGYEWKHKRGVIQSMLKNILKCTANVIYARNTEVREVSGREAYQFLENNHRQGGVHSKIRLGLYEEEELVSLMTFSDMRKTIGSGTEDLSDCFELVRFCSKLDTAVVGGASKLFKEFVSKYNPNRVRSFSDIAHTSGKLYRILGFNRIRKSDPGYVWVNLKNDQAYHRMNAQKRNIGRFLNDEVDLSKTEVELMVEHGFVQVFDSGTLLWEWRKDKEET